MHVFKAKDNARCIYSYCVQYYYGCMALTKGTVIWLVNTAAAIAENPPQQIDIELSVLSTKESVENGVYGGAYDCKSNTPKENLLECSSILISNCISIYYENLETE